MQFVRNLLGEQRRRAVATLMSHIETEVYPHLPQSVRTSLRQQVIGTVGAYHDLCLDVLKASTSDGVVVNEEAMQVLAAIHDRLSDVIDLLEDEEDA